MKILAHLVLVVANGFAMHQETLVYPKLNSVIQSAIEQPIPENRKEILSELIVYLQKKIDLGQEVNLNFICTHNSRRSQFSQIWAATAASYYAVPVNCFSGGVEVTEFNIRAVESIQRSGFQVHASGENNPKFHVSFSDQTEPIIAFSKLFDDPHNSAKEFAAVMTCSHADENCPYIPGTEQRIPIRYEDPKQYDGTPIEAEEYDKRSLQIASELLFVFRQIKNT